MALTDVRRRLPDGFAEKARELAAELIEGADDLRRTRHRARDPESVMHASIDAERLMVRAAEQLRSLA